ncbi:chaperone modulator CbpM [Desulfovibrio psychrotolerans]|uniref:DafA protein n=1 Tax=Desulfovibrio psychrotolerans TaxID=415242 RepID=A0A7J0BR64_9BACT|nr:chaperone modulator CbpM [Desulfovibrio psychrotolerans]GFM35625.1 dafA protein [Desulfovibrio psychrotolerans]
MDKYRYEEDLPIQSEYIAWAEFLELTAVHPTRLGELLELGWLNPARTGQQEYLFTRKDVYRLRKLERICTDFTLSALGGSIIVDLLERIDQLERKVQELELLLRE